MRIVLIVGKAAGLTLTNPAGVSRYYGGCGVVFTDIFMLSQFRTCEPSRWLNDRVLKTTSKDLLNISFKANESNLRAT